jgi:hypothetical protein
MDVENMLCKIVEYSHPTCDTMHWWILARAANILRFINDGKLLHQMNKYHIITEKAVRVSTPYFERTGASWLNIIG